MRWRMAVFIKRTLVKLRYLHHAFNGERPHPLLAPSAKI